MKSVLSLAIVILLTSTLLFKEANAQKTSAGYYKSANFSPYKTFMFPESWSFVEGEPISHWPWQAFRLVGYGLQTGKSDSYRPTRAPLH